MSKGWIIVSGEELKNPAILAFAKSMIGVETEFGKLIGISKDHEFPLIVKRGREVKGVWEIRVQKQKLNLDYRLLINEDVPIWVKTSLGETMNMSRMSARGYSNYINQEKRVSNLWLQENGILQYN